LVEGDLDHLPARLNANAQTAFVGSYVLGMGFTFDDDAAEEGAASSIDEMHRLIRKDPRDSERIFPYIGGEELNTDPRHSTDRYVIDFGDRPLGRRQNLKSWSRMTESERSQCHTRGLVPLDYPDEVAEDWPDLIEIVKRRVKPERDLVKRKALRERWWQYADKRPGLYRAIASLPRVMVTGKSALVHHMIAVCEAKLVFSDKTVGPRRRSKFTKLHFCYVESKALIFQQNLVPRWP
jgi:hypothetical protein